MVEAEDEIKHLSLENEAVGSENERLHKEMHKLQNQLCAVEDENHELQHRLKDALQLIARMDKINGFDIQIKNVCFSNAFRLRKI